MTPSQSAHRIRQLAAREERLQRELMDTRIALNWHGRALCDAHGYRVPLKGPALLRLAASA